MIQSRENETDANMIEEESISIEEEGVHGLKLNVPVFCTYLMNIIISRQRLFSLRRSIIKKRY